MDDVQTSGWLSFAGIVLIVGGIMRFFDSLWAFRYHGSLPSNLRHLRTGDARRAGGSHRLNVE